MTKTNEYSARRIALFPGSFDPFTIGHDSIVRRGLELFDRVIVVVGVNIRKPGSAESAGERVAAISEIYRDEPRVEVTRWDGLTADLARSCGARFILRGVRSVADFEYERNIADINRLIDGLETVMLPATPELAAVSSSMVRELKTFGHDVSEFIPKKQLLS